ncbi:hypothetical protein ZWY2020_034207 [Hordeum vulgare]|nr:hypothetical protein ZWY2020_034207 [Hordeum vulgare]
MAGQGGTARDVRRRGGLPCRGGRAKPPTAATRIVWRPPGRRRRLVLRERGGRVVGARAAGDLRPPTWERRVRQQGHPRSRVGDLAGEVVELGSGVTNFKPGDKVISISFPSGGGLAEYAVAPASLAVRRSSEVSAVVGACLLAAASSCSSSPGSASTGPSAPPVRRTRW